MIHPYNNNLICLLVFCIASSVAVHAKEKENEVGNGCDGLIYSDGRVIVYERYEMQIIGEEIDLGPKNLDPKLKALLAINRLNLFSPWLMQDLHKNLIFIYGSMKIAYYQLSHTDEGSFEIPRGAKVQKIAVQDSPEIPGDPFVKVDREIWDQLSNNDKAIVLLHEAVYMHAARQGIQRAPRVRMLTRMLVAKRPSVSERPLSYAHFLTNFSRNYNNTEALQSISFLLEISQLGRNHIPRYFFY